MQTNIGWFSLLVSGDGDKRHLLSLWGLVPPRHLLSGSPHLESVHRCSESSLIYKDYIGSLMIWLKETELDRPVSFLLLRFHGKVSQLSVFLVPLGTDTWCGVSFPPLASARTSGPAPRHPLAQSCRWCHRPARRGPQWRSEPLSQRHSEWRSSDRKQILENELNYLTKQRFRMSQLTRYWHSVLNHQSASLELLSTSWTKESVWITKFSLWM